MAARRRRTKWFGGVEDLDVGLVSIEHAHYLTLNLPPSNKNNEATRDDWQGTESHFSGRHCDL